MDETHEHEVEAAEHDMDRSIRRLEEERRRLEHDIDESRQDLEEMRRVTGARDIGGTWQGTAEPSGGADPSGTEPGPPGG
jgi:hypothetical protein